MTAPLPRTQIRRLMAGRLEPGWRFSTLYLVKDSLAVMLRSAGLLQDALREFYELEAVYLNAIAGYGTAAGGHEFGALHGSKHVCTVADYEAVASRLSTEYSSQKSRYCHYHLRDWRQQRSAAWVAFMLRFLA